MLLDKEKGSERKNSLPFTNTKAKWNVLHREEKPILVRARKEVFKTTLLK